MKKIGCLIIPGIFLVCLLVIGALTESGSIEENKISPKQSIEQLYLSALDTYERFQYEKSIKLIDSALTYDSLNYRLLLLRGKINYALKDTVKSSIDFNNAFSNISDESTIDKELGLLASWSFEINEPEKAEFFLSKKATLYEKDSILRYYNLLDIAGRYLSSKDSMSAIKCYKNIIEIAPDSAIVRNRLGLLYLGQKKYKSASNEFHRASELDPINANYKFNLATTFHHRGLKTKAKEFYKESMLMGNSDACLSYREITAVTKYSYKSICCDGSTSYSTGRGTCSHHRGVCGTEAVPYKVYIVNCD